MHWFVWGHVNQESYYYKHMRLGQHVLCHQSFCKFAIVVDQKKKSPTSVMLSNSQMLVVYSSLASFVDQIKKNYGINNAIEGPSISNELAILVATMRSPCYPQSIAAKVSTTHIHVIGDKLVLWKFVIRNSKISKSATLIIFHMSFIGTWQLPRTRMLIVFCFNNL